jgi:hypothetical protein
MQQNLVHVCSGIKLLFRYSWTFQTLAFGIVTFTIHSDLFFGSHATAEAQAEVAKAALDERMEKMQKTEQEMVAVKAELTESSSSLRKAKRVLVALKTQVQSQLKELQETSACCLSCGRTILAERSLPALKS